MREPSATLHQSYYGSQLVYAVGYFFFSIAKSEWRGGDKKKLENWNLTCLVFVNDSSGYYDAKYLGGKIL